MALELKTDGDVTTVTDADLVPDGDKDTSYEIRHITTDKHSDLVKQHTSKIPNRRTHQRDNVVDWEAVQEALVDYAIAGWQGVKNRGLAIGADDLMTGPDGTAKKAKFLLDGPRKTAILEVAGMNEIVSAPERREESFRAPADVR